MHPGGVLIPVALGQPPGFLEVDRLVVMHRPGAKVPQAQDQGNQHNREESGFHPAQGQG